MELDERPGPGLGHLESFRNRASFLFKDSLKIARLALVDVSTAELMAEDATNADEWGPTTKVMSDICNVIYNSEDYLRIVQVLHKRFALSAKKHWRQIHKSLILLEYLLCHGPEHLVMEFREDKKRFEELTRFVHVDWTGIDWGAALQRRAKHVLHLLMNEGFYKEERGRAQKISRGISGFGSESLSRRSPHSKPDGDAMDHDHDFDEEEVSSTLLVDDDERILPTKAASKAGGADIPSPVSQSELSWDAFFTSSPRDSLSASGRSTLSCTSDASAWEDSPTSVLAMQKSPLGEKSSNADDFPRGRQAKSSSTEDFLRGRPAQAAPLLLQKLPPPPLVAEYKCVASRDPLRSLGRQANRVKSARVIPDLILI